MGVSAGLYMYECYRKKFTFAFCISWWVLVAITDVCRRSVLVLLRSQVDRYIGDIVVIIAYNVNLYFFS